MQVIDEDRTSIPIRFKDDMVCIDSWFRGDESQTDFAISQMLFAAHGPFQMSKARSELGIVDVRPFGFMRTSTSPNPTPVRDFLNSVKTLRSTDRIRPAIQLIFSTINDWLCESRIDLCCEALDLVDPQSLGVDLSLSFMTITFAARSQLGASRAQLHNRLFKEIERTQGRGVAEMLLPMDE